MLAGKNPSLRAASVAATALLAVALEDFNNLPPHSSNHIPLCEVSSETLYAAPMERLPEWETDSNGKPFPYGVGGRYVSLSHSGGIVAVAVGMCPLGLDVQQMPAPASWERIAKRCAAAGETPPADADGFVRWWTQKEAAVKLQGAGLAYSLRRVPLTSTAHGAQTALDGRGVRITSVPLRRGFGSVAVWSETE